MTRNAIRIALASLAFVAFGATQVLAEGEDLPPNPQLGQCYAKVTVPAKFEQRTERVLKKEASQRIEIVPATYKTVTEQIVVKPASRRLVHEPAAHEWVEEKVMVEPAHAEWVKGKCDPRKQLSNATGECLCLVQVPASYETVRSQRLVRAASTREISVPAEYQTVTKQVVVTPESERRVAIPAVYDTMTRKVMTSEARQQWVRIDCDTKAPAKRPAASKSERLHRNTDYGDQWRYKWRGGN